MAYIFEDPHCQTIWDLAQPKGDKHLTAFAWRENPASLERAWKRATVRKSEEEKSALIQEIKLSAQAQNRYRRELKTTGHKLVRPKGISVWINSGSWAEEIGSHSELREKAKAEKCKCGEPATLLHNSKWSCSRCYETDPEFKRKCYKILCDAGLGKKVDETKEEYIQRLKKYAVTRSKNIGKLTYEPGAMG